MVKRLFDVGASSVGLMLLAPLLLLLAALIKLSSRGPVFYRGERVGRFAKPFRIFKFRTMVQDAHLLGPPATPEDDPRITSVGRFLRKTKLDELPQLFNVLRGEMSLVGPRPEVAIYHQFYTEEERTLVLSVRPGITDYGSLEFHDEGSLLVGCADPVQAYVDRVKPLKVPLQIKYVREQSLCTDLKIIFRTIGRILWTRVRG